MSADRFDGDPRLVLNPGGAALDYIGGQPVMDRGLENQVLISLFSSGSWFANPYLAQSEAIGSGFVEACRQPITLAALVDIANAAELAVKSSYFPSPKATVTNPESDHLAVVIELAPGGPVVAFSRIGARWQAQATDPAYARLQ